MILRDAPSTKSLAAEIIRRGGIVAFRTDTFYGLGVDPGNVQSIRKLINLKGREEGKPILLILADPDDANRYVQDRSNAFDRATGFWPGPLTLVARAQAGIPPELTAGTGTIGVRLPADDNVRDLVRVCGGALTGTSANVSGAPPARSATEVQNQFPIGVDLIIDGGDVEITEPSSVLDVTGSKPQIIREGAVSRKALQKLMEG